MLRMEINSFNFAIFARMTTVPLQTQILIYLFLSQAENPIYKGAQQKYDNPVYAGQKK